MRCERRVAWSACCILLAVCACAAPDRVYWGDVHGHTAASDGAGSFEQYFRWAREEAGLDFAIVSDHDFGNAAPWRMPADVWRAGQDAAEAANEDGTFVAICGYEWTSDQKYWIEPMGGPGGEPLFAGPARSYGHKNVYFPDLRGRVFAAGDPLSATPDLLAAAIAPLGGLAHTNHPGSGEADQWDYDSRWERVIANVEMGPDVMLYEGQEHEIGVERSVLAFLGRGGRAGFVGGSDTHEGRPRAHTAVLSRDLTRAAVFDALRRRRCYATTGARIVLDLRVGGAGMGAEAVVRRAPRVELAVHGTAPLAEVALLRDGRPIRVEHPAGTDFRLAFTDRDCGPRAWYVLRAVQTDCDEHGNPQRAWSSPIWVRRAGSDPAAGP